MKDDSLSPVFNLRGCVFSDVNTGNNSEITNLTGSDIPYKVWDIPSKKWVTNYLERDEFLSSESDLSNTFGVFKNPAETKNTVIQNYTEKETKP